MTAASPAAQILVSVNCWLLDPPILLRAGPQLGRRRALAHDREVALDAVGADDEKMGFADLTRRGLTKCATCVIYIASRQSRPMEQRVRSTLSPFTCVVPALALGLATLMLIAQPAAAQSDFDIVGSWDQPALGTVLGPGIAAIFVQGYFSLY